MVSQSGVLISPHTPHSYSATSATGWETVYITFGGGMVEHLLEYMDLYADTLYLWNQESLLDTFVLDVIYHPKIAIDTFGLYYSTNVYQFLLTLHNYGRLDRKADVSESLVMLEPLIQWLSRNVSNPNIGVEDFANFLSISPRKLNNMFQETFKISPYAFLLNLRIKKAKELLHESKGTTIKEIATLVGFRSVSHFIASFKRVVGLPPEQYKNLH